MNRTASFSVPQNTQFLWLVVTGAPTAHWETHRNGEKKGEENAMALPHQTGRDICTSFCFEVRDKF